MARILLKRSREIDELSSMKKKQKESPFAENHAKNSGIERCALTATFVFLLFLRHDKTRLGRKAAARKTHHAKPQMPVPEMRVRNRRRKRWTCRCTHHSPFEWHTRKPLVNRYTVTTAKDEKVRRPAISSAESSEEWSYLLRDYSEATKLKGKDMVIQLLKCCEEQFWKDLTRNAGGSLTNKSMDEVMAAIKKISRERRKHHGRSCTTSQRESRPGWDDMQLRCLLTRTSQFMQILHQMP